LRCRQSKSKRDIDVALVGDSHAEHLFIGVAEALPDKNVVFYIRDSPPFLYNKDFAKIFKEIISNKSIHTVIYSMMWQYRQKQLPAGANLEQDLAKTVDALMAAGKKFTSSTMSRTSPSRRIVVKAGAGWRPARRYAR
jgi:hypothetical protein